MDIRINIRPLSDAQAKKALVFLQAQGIPGMHKDSVEIMTVADDLYATLTTYQEDNALPPAFLLVEEVD